VAQEPLRVILVNGIRNNRFDESTKTMECHFASQTVFFAIVKTYYFKSSL
jgi:hypothetical protein